MPTRVLVLDDEPITVESIRHVLTKSGMDVVTATTIREAESLLATVVPQVAFVDVYLGEENGIEWTRQLRRRVPDLGIIVISSEDTGTLAEKAVASGADAFLSKPVSPSALTLTIAKLRELREERTRVHELERDLKRTIRDSAFPEIISHGDAMRGVLSMVEKVAPRDLSVLICGESGTGKELIARAIHQGSSRRGGPFVELNCAALPPNLVESELFGHEKGAFTGAYYARAGKIEQANGGTLFLDEIGELPLETQPKLLRALQERRVTRVGGKGTIESDFRLVSATNREIALELAEGRFREDLFYRVAVFPIKLPPLRARMEDFDLLLSHFLRQENVTGARITPEAMDLLHHYQWPGNVRELKNFSQAIVLYIENGLVTAESIRQYFGSRIAGPSEVVPTAGQTVVPVPKTPPAPRSPVPIGDPRTPVPSGLPRAVRKLANIEREEILYALRYYNNNVSEAARALDMGRATLYKYLKKHDIPVK